MAQVAERRAAGRPSNVDLHGTATRERLLAATVASCVEHGYRGATMADIATRAGVSAPAIYNHFGDKAALLVEAGRWALDRLDRGADAGRATAADVVHTFASPEFAETGRFLSELHLAAQRDAEIADLLADWHRDQAARWAARSSGRDGQVAVKTFFVLLLGLCQLDALASLPASRRAVEGRATQMLSLLFPEEETR